MQRRLPLASVLLVALVATFAVAEEVYEAGVDGVTAPVVIGQTQAAPEYPPAAFAAGFEGAVTLAAVVQPDGTVGEVEVLETDHPNLGFEEAAMAAMKQWEYEPAVRAGQPVATYSVVRLHFRSPRAAGRAGAFVTGDFLPTSTRMGVSGIGVAGGKIGIGGGLPATGNGYSTQGTSTREQPRSVNLPPRTPGAMYDRRTLIPPRETLYSPGVSGN